MTPITFDRTYHAPAEKVWDALVNPAKMKQWYFDIPGFQPVVGYRFEFLGGREGREYRHLCEITEVVPGRKLTYSWRYDGYAGNSFVTFELFPEGTDTRLLLTHRGLETFPKEVADFAPGNFVEGWTSILGKSLPKFLES
ncbi:SRPBCC family protein [Siphonobacter aquaeclarae]|jgi:uncharacterized protein YndB with AHSA1/START domain|uniref:Uncharacterized conserved protein YndB, AHSA1/START domain n=1 Tax=Siphonobacter aquaeclarae TaxID=563176 RepID=A0A1G9HHH1_9BACT|nr:SRPBCC domain-containing protein [Siphonobacter aquaeclarae]SDL12335.1 Uncharacterized conserved protein YndB, AHSA1/START domain [Siphonobacter aquaeclarae]